MRDNRISVFQSSRKHILSAAGCLAAMVAACLLCARAGAMVTNGEFITAGKIKPPANFTPDHTLPGDVNGDNRVDFVSSGSVYDPVTGGSGSAIMSLLDNGDGTVRGVTAIASHGQSVLTLADLDGDGKLDLVCVFIHDDPTIFREQDTDVEISHGLGDGTFTPLHTYTLIGGAFLPGAAGDINGDGKIDLVVSTRNGYQVLLNDGSGAFHPGTTFSANNQFGFRLQDVNRDGRSDLVIPLTGNKLLVALGLTSGGFSTATTYTTSADPRDVAIADLNGDGNPDIAVGTVSGVDVFLGDGSGAFHPGIHVRGSPVSSVALAKLGKNGKLDLIVMNESVNQLTQDQLSRLSVFPGNGDGTFGGPRVYNAPSEPVTGAILGAIDVNGDKALDVVLADLTVFEGDGYGSLRAAPITRSPDAGGIVTGDFNGDGITDVAVANLPECTGGEVCEVSVSVFLGNGANWFPPAKVSHAGIFGAYTPVGMGMATGDVNGDGKLDIVLKGGDTQTLSVLLGNGDGTFKAPKTSDVLDGSLEVQLADVNNDKKLDVMLQSGVLLGNGDGSFGAAIPYPDYGFRGISKVAVADLNGDGKPDLIASIDTVTGPYTPDTYGLATLLGDGTGHFTKAAEWSTCCFVTQIVPANMNGDKFPDIVVAFGSDLGTFPLEGLGISVFVNKGDGTFPGTNPLFYPVNSRYIVVGDFTGDGINDVAGLWSQTLTLLPGAGDGTLGSNQYPFAHTFAAINGPLAAADLNRDGALDIVTANLLGVSRYINAAKPGTAAKPAAAKSGTLNTGFSDPPRNR
jgi:FG-GAP-like repeat/FG-GAP repeat